MIPMMFLFDGTTWPDVALVSVLVFGVITVIFLIGYFKIKL